MVLVPALLVSLTMHAQDAWTPPPLVPAETASAPTTPPPEPPLVPAPPPVHDAPPAPAVEQPASPGREGPLWAVSALGTATVPASLTGSTFLAGLRGEVEVLGVSALVSVDRTVTTPALGVTPGWSLDALPLTAGTTDAWTALLGLDLVSWRYFRARVLAGAGALACGTSTTLAPALGGTARVGFSWLAAEVAAVVTPGAFARVDARLEGVLHVAIFELRAGWRAHALSAAGELSVVALTPTVAPSVAFGLSI